MDATSDYDEAEHRCKHFLYFFLTLEKLGNTDFLGFLREWVE
jgi:hypothetical protein